MFSARTPILLRKLNTRVSKAVVAVASYATVLCAFPKHSKVFLRHEQAMIGEFNDIVFQSVHCLRAGDRVRHIQEKITQHFRSKELMNPYLVPSSALKKNIARRRRPFTRVQCKVRTL